MRRSFEIIGESGGPIGRFRSFAPFSIGGVIVCPDDIAIGDIDGVVAVPRRHAEAVLATAMEIDKREPEQAKLIIGCKSLRQGQAKHDRI
jgi:4-hydroxy-4-methyl-2-oxoglutarate aldolase